MRLGGGELGYLAYPLRSEEGCVDGSGEGCERLVGADVRVGLRAPDVLLATTQSKDVGELAVLVHRLPGDAPGELPHELLVGRHVPCVRATEEEGHPEWLGLPHRDIGPEVARALQDGEGYRVAHCYGERLYRVRCIRRRLDVLDYPEVVGALDEDAGNVVRHIGEVGGAVLERELYQLDPVGLDDLEVASVQPFGDSDLRVALRQSGCHQGSLGDGVRAVVDRGVGDLEACKLGDHRLKLEDYLEVPLADLGLVGRVGGEVLAAPYDRAYGGGHYTIVGSRADEERESRRVLLRQLVHVGEGLVLGERRRQVEILLQLWRDVGEEVVQAIDPDGLEHLLYVGLGVRCESRHAAIPPVLGWTFYVLTSCPRPESITPSAPVPCNRTLQDALRRAVLLPERFGSPPEPFTFGGRCRRSLSPATLSRGPH